MKQVFVLLLAMLPVTALAQEPIVPEGGPTAADVQARPAAQTPPAARPDTESRRRPSMVGYIGDSSISSKFRIRYDAGYDITAADRVEFFYAKCGCYRTLPTSNAAYDPDAPGPGPGVLTSANFAQLYFLAEYAGNQRFSVYAELPIRFLRPQSFAPGTGSFGPQDGISDLRLGAKVGLASTAARQLTAAFQVGVPTGDAKKGLGRHYATVEPMLLYEERPTDRFAVEAQFGDVIPVDASAGVPTTSSKKFGGSVLYYGIGPSYLVYRSPRVGFAPVVELVGWHVVKGYQTANSANADGLNIVNLKVGGRILTGDTGSIYIGYGHALTDAAWYTDIVRFEYRVAFGR